jgi:hypothetical protein
MRVMRAPTQLFVSALLSIATPLVSLSDENSICGRIESGQLTIALPEPRVTIKIVVRDKPGSGVRDPLPRAR